jgi:hypothetical protein
MPLLARAGHFATLLNFVPVVGFMVWLGLRQAPERRRARRDAG